MLTHLLYQGDNVGKTMQNASDTANFTESYFNAAFGSQPNVASDLFSGKLGCREDVGLDSRFVLTTSSRQPYVPFWSKGDDSGPRDSDLGLGLGGHASL